MSTIAASLSGDLASLLSSIDPSLVRSNQRWVLAAVRKDGPALVRLLWRMLGREQDVLDAYQECFCKLIAMAEKEGEVPCRSYVFRTAMNAALDIGRRRKVTQEHMPSMAFVAREKALARAPGDSSDGLIEALRTAIEALPRRLREIVVLRDLAELSYKEVARILGLTSGTARVYRREAIVALTESMGATRGSDQ